MKKHFIILSLCFLHFQLKAQQTFTSVKQTTIMPDGNLVSDNSELNLEFYKPKDHPVYQTTGNLFISEGGNLLKSLELEYFKQTKLDKEITDWYHIVNERQYGFNILKITKLSKNVFGGKYLYLISLEEYNTNHSNPIMTQSYFITKASIITNTK
jgi:hypothetical protein